MPGNDSSYMWQGYIPKDDNPHSLNPEQGFLSSANQRPADGTYPYFIPGAYEVYRPITINRKLSALNSITVEDMMALQNNNYNVFAEQARPLLLKYIDRSKINKEERVYLNMVESWNLMNDPGQKEVVCFTAWWDSLQTTVFDDELIHDGKSLIRPEKFVLLEALLRDSSFKFIDNIHTTHIEDLKEIITLAFKKTIPYLNELTKNDKMEWGKYKNTTVYHLLKTNAMPFARTGLLNGGGKGIVNASQHDHGPSWRMIIELTTPTNAYAVYPGGQSGNPGSQFYDNFIETWTKGEYYKLWMMDEVDRKSEDVKWKMSFSPKA
jgi:penicillin amidase